MSDERYSVEEIRILLEAGDVEFVRSIGLDPSLSMYLSSVPFGVVYEYSYFGNSKAHSMVIDHMQMGLFNVPDYAESPYPVKMFVEEASKKEAQKARELIESKQNEA